MGVGLQLKTLLRARGLTIKQLSADSGVPLNTLYSITKRDSERIDPVIRQQLARVLSVPEYLLMNEHDAKSFVKSAFWSVDLEEKLKHVFFSIGWDEEDGTQWINYPDGTLEVDIDELKSLNDSVDSFLKFKLSELKEKHKDEFRPRKQKPADIDVKK